MGHRLRLSTSTLHDRLHIRTAFPAHTRGKLCLRGEQPPKPELWIRLDRCVYVDLPGTGYNNGKESTQNISIDHHASW